METPWRRSSCTRVSPLLWCDFWCNVVYKTRLTLPCMSAFFANIAWIGKKVITYYLKTPFFQISANLPVFCRSVTRPKTRAGRLGQVLYAKSHRNRMKNCMCKGAFFFCRPKICAFPFLTFSWPVTWLKEYARSYAIILVSYIWMSACELRNITCCCFCYFFPIQN